MLLVALELTCY